MSRGRIVRVYDPEFVKGFDVAIEDSEAAIAAVRAAHPTLGDCQMEADERLSATAVAFLETNPGEVKERLSLEPG